MRPGGGFVLGQKVDGGRLVLPEEVLRDVTAIVGRRGRGKTTTAVVLVEEAHQLGRRFCVVDPTGAWWGLRSSRDGKSAGIPCVVFGGKHQMAQLEPTAGKLLAEFVADPTQPSVVLDVKLWSRGEQIRFLTDFLSTLYQKNDAPLLLVLDEADQVAPQQAEPGERVLLGAAQRLVKLGRVSGFGVILVTQRPASLNKNVMNMAGVLVTLGLTGPQDHKAVFSWMQHRADEKKAKEIMSSLPGLPQGRAWVWAPELDVLALVDVRDRQTFDSSATPHGNKTITQPRAVAEVDLDGLTAAIKATIEKAKAEDPRELRRTITDLQAKLAAAAKAKPAPAVKPATAPRTVEKLILKDAQVKRLEAVAGRIDRAMVQLGKWAQAFTGTEREIRNVGAEILAALAAARGGGGGASHGELNARPRGRAEALRSPGTIPPAPAGRDRPAPAVTRPRASEGDGDGRISGPQQKILDAAAFLEGVGVPQPDVVQLALFAGLSATGGYWRANIGRLRTLGLIEGTSLTDAGRAVAREAEIQTVDQLHDHVLTNLLTGPQRTILRVLIDAYPSGLSRDELGKRASLEPAGGYWRANLGRLRSLGLVSKREPIQALPVLFLEGA